MSTKTTETTAADKAAERKLAADAKAVFVARNPKGKNAVPASWASIGAKLGISPATARRLYDRHTGTPGSHHSSRIPGKGGRTVKASTEEVAA